MYSKLSSVGRSLFGLSSHDFHGALLRSSTWPDSKDDVRLVAERSDGIELDV